VTPSAAATNNLFPQGSEHRSKRHHFPVSRSNALNQQHTKISPAASANSAAIVEPGVPIIAREGWPIVAIFILVAGLLTVAFYYLYPPLGYVMAPVGSVLTLWCLWFFRDPKRTIPQIPGVIVSPADGVICQVSPATPPADLGLTESATAGMTRVSVFMNVFNVHVNRAPCDCTVTKVAYHPGKFFNASLDKASEHNERNSLSLRCADGTIIACVQIAGLVARRIVLKKKEGDRLLAGQRYGLIRFGSRVDVYLPAGVPSRVSVGQRMVAGETIIAVLPAKESR
jgi:phosphatidylserine decarboxylase